VAFYLYYLSRHVVPYMHERRPTQKVGDRGQNINRIPEWRIPTVVTKTSIKQIPLSVSI